MTDALLTRAGTRSKRLRMLADDPYACGTERYDADLIDALCAEVATLKAARLPDGLQCRDLGECMSQLQQLQTAEAEVATLRDDRDRWQLSAHTLGTRCNERLTKIEHLEARLAAQAEALETLEQTAQKIRAWQNSSMTGYDTALELLCEVADQLAALRTTGVTP